MAQMSRYCKAYPAQELRRFPEWHEQLPPLVVRPEGAAAEETAYFYLHDNYVVTAGLYRDENIAFDRVTDAWTSFCSRVLDFVVPDAGAGSSS
jgi:hypothetical protein